VAAAAKTKRETPGRGRGRPARLSREAIFEAALGLLEREPATPLTLSRVAEEVDAVPTALYRHVASLDAVLDGVLGLVLEGIAFEIRPRTAWRTQVRDWMTSVRSQLLRYPAVVALIGRRGRTSPAWLAATDVLAGILERAALPPSLHARAFLWIAESTMGAVVTEASVPFAEQIEAARAALPALPEAVRTRQAPILAELAAMDGDAWFALVIDQTLAGVVDLADRATPRR
jgi:AcrR family transcriptional regulator